MVDVRTVYEFAENHLQRAQNIDYFAADFVDKLVRLDQKACYLIYCRSGARSARALDILQGSGFENVYDIKGGYEAWKTAGLPVVK